MTKFEAELKNNNFVCSLCENCQHWVWPPSDLCNKCFGNVIWKPVSKIARLVEKSSKDGKDFCIAEFDGGIRVFGSILGSSSGSDSGQNLMLEHCAYDKTPKFIFRII